MGAGSRDRRVKLLRSAEVENDFGSGGQSWTVFADVAASRRDIGDAERVKAAQTGASVTARFRILWSPEVADVSPADQLVCDGRRYEICAVKEITSRPDGGRVTDLEITAAYNANLPAEVEA
jgi:SPP1 family predicted phage head-tail adaptor